MALLRLSSQLPRPLCTICSFSSQSIHNLSITFPQHQPHHIYYLSQRSSRRRSRSSVVVGASKEDTETSTRVTTSDDDDENFDQDPDPQDLEYVSQIKGVLELLKKNRDMLFSEVKLTVMIEDPREVERKRLLGIDDADAPTREDLAAVLEEVNEGKIPQDRVALQMLAEEMVEWPNLEVEATKKGPRKSRYAKATDTGVDPQVAAKRLNIDWDSAAEIEEDDDATDNNQIPSALGYGALYLVSAFPVIIAPLVGAYGGYKGESRDWPRSFYVAPRDESSPKEFNLRLICPTANIGGVIGKGSAIINQIRLEMGAGIKVDSSKTEAEDCIISISAKEIFEDTFSPAIEAALRLQPRCSDRVERDSGLISFTTRLLVPTSRIGCLIGKGGAIITEIRRITKANIRILSKENLPKVAEDDDEMVQISAELDLAKDALLQVISRLRANLFEKDCPVSTFVPVLPYLPVAPDAPDVSKYESRDSKGHGRGHSYSGGYGASSDLPANDGYGSYGSLQGRSSGDTYGAYGSYSTGRSGSSGISRHNSSSRQRDYGY